ncbi:hypothetical protein Emtol_2873 [Emticicia oligotrophica DSM 17448]|uniref:Uncharacterized protein n=1 Tax=Emticicia oligotrophica (strain DSM 17448 / CIP 109782 / MTCC 6937 / GPTSA100-15) TaxID=929562 RepID=A0ABM5N3T1_EMTOG|nr:MULTISPECIES: hypothetical protein [Emticicia]AFK04006.1 hypothetical protein Emtol_2873 [Emticicia oligotrophica DSM 17448]
MRKILSAIILLLVLTCQVYGQAITLFPGEAGNLKLSVLTNGQIRNFSNPQVGMMVFDKTYGVVRVYNGSSWICLTCTNQAFAFNDVKIANLKSFTLKSEANNTYTANAIRDFKASDNAIGDVTTSLTGLTPNAIVLDSQEVIAFEQPLPQTMQNLSSQDLLNLITQSQWTSSYVYNQPIDVAVRSDDANLIYYVREAGSFERKEGSIMGMKAYRFTNKIFIEKYNPFSIIFDRVIKNNTSVNLRVGLGIGNLEEYNIISTSEAFIINNGMLSFSKATDKPANNYGIIYFLPKSVNLPSYRLRVFTHRPSTSTINTFFDANGMIKNKSNYLNNYYGDVLTTNTPFILYLPTGTKLRSIAEIRVPPPTAGTEE